MMIEVLHADDLYDQVESRTGRRLARLLGNVSFRHKEVYMLCDSAHFIPDRIR